MPSSSFLSVFFLFTSLFSPHNTAFHYNNIMSDYIYPPHTDKINYHVRWHTPTNPISGYYPSLVPFAVNYCDYVEKHNRLIMKQIREEEKKAGLTKSKHEPSYSEAEASSSYWD